MLNRVVIDRAAQRIARPRGGSESSIFEFLFIAGIPPQTPLRHDHAHTCIHMHTHLQPSPSLHQSNTPLFYTLQRKIIILQKKRTPKKKNKIIEPKEG